MTALVETPPEPEISQAAARAMLAALVQITGALDDWAAVPAPRDNAPEERALVVAAELGRAVVRALAEGRAQ